MKLTGLNPGTTYTYCAFVDVDGQIYYGEDKTFTTETEIPDLTGTWNCIEYNSDGTVLDESTIEVSSDGKAIIKGNSWVSDDTKGSWSISADGVVNFSFEQTIGSSWNPQMILFQVSGSLKDSSFECTSKRRRYAYNSGNEYYNEYKAKLTR